MTIILAWMTNLALKLLTHFWKYIRTTVLGLQQIRLALAHKGQGFF